jgi:hypothetical protein
MTRTFSAGLMVALVFAGSSARGAILFERSLVVDRSTNIFSSNTFDLRFDFFAGSFFQPVNVVKLFDGLKITPGSVGTTLEANSATDPNFASAAARLTDALNQNIQLLFKESSSAKSELRGWNESGFFLGLSTPQHPDLAGAKIDAIRLHVDQFTLLFGSSPSAATTPPVDLRLTFSVIGSPVPEPTSLGLASGSLAIASLVAYTVARRRRAALVAASFPRASERRDYGMALRADD